MAGGTQSEGGGVIDANDPRLARDLSTQTRADIAHAVGALMALSAMYEESKMYDAAAEARQTAANLWELLGYGDTPLQGTKQ
jgi:hypothetical protein